MSSASGSGAGRLGRGLEALLGVGSGAGELIAVPVGAVEPNRRQPRGALDDAAVDELAASVRAHGLVQPIVVRPLEHGRYELVAGERRWRAACRAGLATVPALVRETDERESLLLALVENLAREDLSALDEARAYAVLQDEFGLGLGEIAERVGRSKPAVSNRLRLLDLPEDVLALLARGELTEGHARAVLAVHGNEERRRLADRIVRHGMSVRSAERAARSAGARRKPRRASAVDPALAARARSVLEALTA
ncbi:MAG: ParB/RepB/Spo0J family partition protein, partial [Actinomycetota bacterium]|nr:ParB/RepB/Spo0J family partition protein [Actinomycetota bacterium]